MPEGNESTQALRLPEDTTTLPDQCRTHESLGNDVLEFLGSMKRQTDPAKRRTNGGGEPAGSRVKWGVCPNSGTHPG